MTNVEFPCPVIQQVLTGGKINRINGLTAEGNDSAVMIGLTEAASKVLKADATIFMHWCYGPAADEDVLLTPPQYVNLQQTAMVFKVPLALLKKSAGKTVYVYYKYAEPGVALAQVIHKDDATRFLVDRDVADAPLLGAPEFLDARNNTLYKSYLTSLRLRLPADAALRLGADVDVTVRCRSSNGGNVDPDHYTVREKVTRAAGPLVVSVSAPAWATATAGTIEASYIVDGNAYRSGTATVVLSSDDPANASLSLWVCGAGSHFQTGHGSSENLETFVPAGGDRHWKMVTQGGASHLAIDADGRLFAWGRSDVGQTGTGSVVDVKEPTECWFGEARMQGIIHASSSLWYSLALDSSGGLWLSGKPDAGTSFSTNVFRKIADGPFAQVSAGNAGVGAGSDACYCSFAIGAQGTLYGWGQSDNGLLGVAGRAITLPEPLAGLETLKWKQATHQHDYAAAITNGGDLYMWGRNYSDRNNLAGAGGSDGRNELVSPTNGRVTIFDNQDQEVKWRQIVLGGEHVLAIDSKNRLWGWGRNIQSSLTKLADEDHVPPSRILPAFDVVDVCANPGRGAALTEKGHVYVWGTNAHHQIGLSGAETVYASPAKLSFADRVAALAFGAESMILLSENAIAAD